jgi:myo-inositol 2-dehydrogenase/D-chiro-inositol 1-dehydrogenase
MTVRIGLIGAGHMGEVHGRLLAQDERVQLAGVYDPCLERAAQLAPQLGATAAFSLEELWDQRLDAVYVLSPNTRHREPVLAAVERGIHVFSEKPMATSLSEADQIRAAVESAPGLVYQVGLNRRFAPVYQAAKEVAGTATLAHFKMNRGELQNPAWVSDTTLTGGFLYESTYHLLDLARWLFGEVLTVNVQAKTAAYQELDNFAMLLRFASGLSLTFASCAHATWLFPFERLELFGPHWALVTDEMERVTYVPGLGAETRVREFFPVPVVEKWGYREEDRRFVAAVLGEGASPVPASDAYRTVELVEACYRSARTGEPVTLG